MPLANFASPGLHLVPPSHLFLLSSLKVGWRLEEKKKKKKKKKKKVTSRPAVNKQTTLPIRSKNPLMGTHTFFHLPLLLLLLQ